ncbi:MAG: hypothetical protein KGI78_00640 [Patescibacteria group bacterium]|nr:hypothetical protein [Patescibacteria group bacterium]MDE1944273.1 hypothetical protein [Patescibacteria group bacterium]MDE1944660.1 hypothetical protein [Patescibacteria group bacterium]MDE2057346.1 hypothetical protein [Patescibacteria group bacterium]
MDQEQISFDSQDTLPAAAAAEERRSFAALLVELSGGAIADERQASYVLLGVALVAGAIALYLLIPALAGSAKLPTGHVTPPPGAPPGWAPPAS